MVIVILKATCFIRVLGLLGILFWGNMIEAVQEEERSEYKIDPYKVNYVAPRSIPYPEDNPFTQEKFELGKKLFFDPRLSKSNEMACSTCHRPSLSWSDGLSKGIGKNHQELPRKTPTLFNLAWGELFYWDGRASSLEEQSLMPIYSKVEMDLDPKSLIAKLQTIKGYAPLFKEAFPKEPEITPTSVAKALATFSRGLVSVPAPFDRWIDGDEKAISKSAKRGFRLFNGKANCASCHSGWQFSDESFHDIGLNTQDLGRGEHLPHIVVSQYAFKTPGLRNIAQRGPYMHAGQLSTLEDVIKHYIHPSHKRPSFSNQMQAISLSQEEINDLIEFLNTLSSPMQSFQLPELPN